MVSFMSVHVCPFVRFGYNIYLRLKKKKNQQMFTGYILGTIPEITFPYRYWCVCLNCVIFSFFFFLPRVSALGENCIAMLQKTGRRQAPQDS